MADKKINQLDDAGALTGNDYWVVNQDHSTGKALKVALAVLRTYVLGGANAGSRVYFQTTPPVMGLGVDTDVVFDQSGRHMYQKSGGVWVDKGSYGPVPDYIRFTSAYGSGGLSANGKVYTNASLVGGFIVSVKVNADDLIPVATPGDTPLFDEYDFDPVAGSVICGAPLPVGFRVTVVYMH